MEDYIVTLLIVFFVFPVAASAFLLGKVHDLQKQINKLKEQK